MQFSRQCQGAVQTIPGKHPKLSHISSVHSLHLFCFGIITPLFYRSIQQAAAYPGIEINILRMKLRFSMERKTVVFGYPVAKTLLNQHSVKRSIGNLKTGISFRSLFTDCRHIDL